MASYLKESLRQALEAVEKRERAHKPEDLPKPSQSVVPPSTDAVQPRGLSPTLPDDNDEVGAEDFG